jgi:hypothetical protein
VTSVASGALTTDRDPHGPSTGLPAIPLPNVNFHPVIGVQAGWVSSSMAGAIGSPASYGESSPRSRRLSWMLLRARLARMAS